MSANRNSLPNPAHSISAAAQISSGLFSPAGPHRPNRTHKSPHPASRLPASHLRREPRRWLYVSTGYTRRKPTPFRGSGLHSPPRWRTRKHRSDFAIQAPAEHPPSTAYLGSLCPCPLQEKSRDMHGQIHPAIWPSDQPFHRAHPTPPAYNSRQETFLRNLLTITRIGSGVNAHARSRSTFTLF